MCYYCRTKSILEQDFLGAITGRNWKRRGVGVGGGGGSGGGGASATGCTVMFYDALMHV